MERVSYLEFDLKIEREGDSYRSRVRSPSGEAWTTFTLPFSAERLELLVVKLAHARSRTRRIHFEEIEAAQELGGKLFDAVFGGEVRACLRRSLDQAAQQEGMGLRLKLRLQDVPELADLPWEFLYDPSLDRFFAQSTRTPIVRYIEIPERIKPLTVSLPLRLLVMISNPDDPHYARLDAGRERARLDAALISLRREGMVHVEYLDKATLAELQRSLGRGQFHVFHFIGHGGFDERTEEGVLVLEDEQERGWLAGARRIGTFLHDHPSLRLAVLNACEGARNSPRDPFAGVATTLMRQGVPAVVAMQFEITDEAAILFSGQFYAALSLGYPVDAAMAEARKAIYGQPNDVEWGTPVLYTRAPDGVLFTVTGQSRELESTEFQEQLEVELLQRARTPASKGVEQREQARAEAVATGEQRQQPTGARLVQPSIPAKSPTTAAIISFFLPGIGQVYLGQRKKGWILFGSLPVLTFVLLLEAGDAEFFWLLAVIAAAIDAYKIGTKLKKGLPVEEMEFLIFWKG